MSPGKFKGSTYLSGEQNKNISSRLRECEDCLVTAQVQVYANYFGDPTKSQHFKVQEYRDEGWVKCYKYCGLCFLKENKKIGFELKLFDLKGSEPRLLLELPVDHGLSYEFESPSNLFLFGQAHRLCLHFLHHKEGSKFQEQLKEVCREWKLEDHRNVPGNTLVDQLAIRIREQSSDGKKEWKMNRKEQKDRAEEQKAHNQILGKVRLLDLRKKEATAPSDKRTTPSDKRTTPTDNRTTPTTSGAAGASAAPREKTETRSPADQAQNAEKSKPTLMERLRRFWKKKSQDREE